jgi:hypothetical protein
MAVIGEPQRIEYVEPLELPPPLRELPIEAPVSTPDEQEVPA